MNFFSKLFLPILLSTFWISLSEFARNEFLLKTHWTKHYEGMGLVFPSAPINGAVWGIWSLSYAICIFVVSRRFSFLETFLLTWFFGFVLMWLVIGNMGVLPYSILSIAIPLSLLETSIAVFIFQKLS